MPHQILKVKTKEAVLKCFEKCTEHNGKSINEMLYIFLIFRFPKWKFSKLIKEGRKNLKTSGVGRRQPTDLFLNHCFRKNLQKRI
jgi:hypothetical protein